MSRVSIRQKKEFSHSLDPRSCLWSRLERCRQASTDLVQGLEAEDMTVQPIADVSPLKWHLAHTSWFFEELILAPNLKSYKKFDEGYHHLFNSYYKALGPHWVQGDRGSLSRPTVKAVLAFRKHVDKGLQDLFAHHSLSRELLTFIELGLQHEQQHQELILMDVKYILSRNPSLPSYSSSSLAKGVQPTETYETFPEGIYEIGAGEEGFCFDNERARHKVYLYPFALSNAFVTNGQYREFIEDGGYRRPEFWLSLGWDWVEGHQIQAPLYWAKNDGIDTEFTLNGPIALDAFHPVSHINYFEASAYAKWKGQRLPREAELEIYLSRKPIESPKNPFHATNANGVHKQLWAWTQSSYSPYPGFQEFRGPTKEYNGKFMCNQYVLRGGCLATPDDHYRPTYRNFFLPQQRWMFSGIRLAKDCS